MWEQMIITDIFANVSYAGMKDRIQFSYFISCQMIFNEPKTLDEPSFAKMEFSDFIQGEF